MGIPAPMIFPLLPDERRYVWISHSDLGRSFLPIEKVFQAVLQKECMDKPTKEIFLAA